MVEYPHDNIPEIPAASRDRPLRLARVRGGDGDSVPARGQQPACHARAQDVEAPEERQRLRRRTLRAVPPRRASSPVPR